MLEAWIEEQLEQVAAGTAVDLPHDEMCVGSPVQLVRCFVGIDRGDPDAPQMLGPASIDRAEFGRGNSARKDFQLGASQESVPTEPCRLAGTVQRRDQLSSIHADSLTDTPRRTVAGAASAPRLRRLLRTIQSPATEILDTLARLRDGDAASRPIRHDLEWEEDLDEALWELYDEAS